MKVTISILKEAKKNGQKFSVVSCYDYTMAKLAFAAGINVLLVGDSASQFTLGFGDTKSISMDFMIAITSAVRRVSPELFVIADMPYQGSRTQKDTVNNARRYINECGADIVKIEAAESDFDTIKAVIDACVPVVPHLGIRPQTGQYKAEGTTAEVGAKIIELAQKSLEIGAQMLLLEGTAREVAKIIAQKLPIPVIGCGSGPDCDGQVLVLPDILSLKDGPSPKFAKSFGDIGKKSVQALSLYNQEITNGCFPDDNHSYHMKPGELEKLLQLIK